MFDNVYGKGHVEGMDVFISHTMADKNAAERIAAELRACGLSVSLPYQDVGLGENWGLKVGQALEQANAMVVVLSPDAVASGHVQKEIGYALGSPRFQGRLIPVMVKKTGKIPWILQDLEVMKTTVRGGLLGRKIADRLRQRRVGSFKSSPVRAAYARV